MRTKKPSWRSMLSVPLTSICLLILSAGITLAEYNYTDGSYAMWDSTDPIPPEIINNPGVVGVLTGARWFEIEPEEGVYDWSKLDAKISQAEQAGFKVTLKIQASPAWAPDWLRNNPGVQKINVVDINPYHEMSYCKELSYPVFWDSIFHEKKKELIREAGGDIIQT